MHEVTVKIATRNTFNEAFVTFMSPVGMVDRDVALIKEVIRAGGVWADVEVVQPIDRFPLKNRIITINNPRVTDIK